MIQPPVPTVSGGGVAFSDASDGDIRGERGRADRLRQASRNHGPLGDPRHRCMVPGVEVDDPGDQGQADAMFTSRARAAAGDLHRRLRGRGDPRARVRSGWPTPAGGESPAAWYPPLLRRCAGAGFEPAMAADRPEHRDRAVSKLVPR